MSWTGERAGWGIVWFIGPHPAFDHPLPWGEGVIRGRVRFGRECFERVGFGEESANDVGGLVRHRLAGEMFVVEEQGVAFAAMSLERDGLEESTFVVRFVADFATVREICELAILANQAVNQFAVGVVFCFEMCGVVEADAASVLPARSGVAGTLEMFDRAIGSVFGVWRRSCCGVLRQRLEQKVGVSVELIEARNLLGEDFTRAVSRLQICVAGDAVPAAGFGQHLGPFVLLMTGRARDVSMSWNLIRVMFADTVAGHALLVIDRVGIVGEGNQPLQRSPRRVTAPAFVLKQPMRRGDVARLIDLVLTLEVLQREPQQRADSRPQCQPPSRASQAIRLSMHVDVHSAGKFAAGTLHDGLL